MLKGLSFLNYYGNTITKLIEEFAKLPGIGGRLAQRIAFHIIDLPLERVESLSETILAAKRGIKYCSQCCNLTDNDPCFICSNINRDHKTIMVVEDPRAMAAYEKTREYKGVYHVLHGAMSPMNGIGPDEIKIKELLKRTSDSPPDEVILATNPTVEGEATAMYIAKLLDAFDLKVTRIANGVPVGSDLEYVDEVTLSRALEGRHEI